ncbi:MAG TPA: hypothetical protein VF199_08635 [Bacillales bacterium]
MSEEMDTNYLQSLVGKTVRLFKGGPESRVGRLLDVKSDYLTMDTKEDGVVYYNLMHIKSVGKNSKEDQLYQERNAEEDSFLDSDSSENCFHEKLESLRNQEILIDRGGPESRKGKLLDLREDFLVLENDKEGVIYYRIHHIKSISRPKNSGLKIGSGPDTEAGPEYVREASDFDQLLKILKYRWIQINRGGPECIEGILIDSNKEYLVLAVNDEVNHIPIFHIRNINVVIHAGNNNQHGKEDQKESQGKGSQDNGGQDKGSQDKGSQDNGGQDQESQDIGSQDKKGKDKKKDEKQEKGQGEKDKEHDYGKKKKRYKVEIKSKNDDKKEENKTEGHDEEDELQRSPNIPPKPLVFKLK